MEFHCFGSASIQMDALESHQRANGSAINGWMRKIELHNFIAGGGTDVRYAYGNGNRAVCGNLCRAHFGVGIVERRKTQSVPERIERRLSEISVGAAGHGIVSK